LVINMKPIPAFLPRMRSICFPTIVLIAAAVCNATPVTGIAPTQTPASDPQWPCEEIVANASAEGQVASTIPAELDLYIECEMRERQIPGVALAITRGGEILTERAYGLASIQNNSPVTTGTRFAIASITKPITAMGIMLLVEDGKVELDAPVSRYLTEAPAEWHAITVRHLLNHTSGLPEGGWAEWKNQDREDLLRLSGLHRSTEPLYRLALQDTLWFVPGTDWVYSNVGYFLLGVITERASGMSWRDFIHERIFLPLGMTDSYISDGWTIYDDEARGYTIYEDTLRNNRGNDFSWETPSMGSGIFSNGGDLAKLDAALHTGQFLSEESRRAMWAPTELPAGRIFPYGLGWEVWGMRGHRVQYHAGSAGAEFLRLPDDSLAVTVLTNLGEGTRHGLSHNVAKLLIPELKRPSLREIPIPEAELRRYSGQYESISGRPFEVKLEDGRLVAPYPWPFPRRGGEAALIHQGNHVFEFVDHDGRIVFRMAEDGTVAGLSAIAWDGGYQSDFRWTEQELPLSTHPEVDVASTTSGSTPRSDERAVVAEFEAYVEQSMHDWGVPGLSVAVVRDDTVLLARGYGVREVGEPGAVDEHTLFGIMSTTKAMTSASIAMLVDDGKVAWSDPVAKWIPELQFPDPFLTRELTIKDLLTHNSGLGNADLMWVRDDLDVDEILRRVRYLKPEYSLRSSFVYQNIMYIAAGEVVARASGMSFAEFLRTRIFAPLGMTRSYSTLNEMAESGDSNVSRAHLELRDTVRVISEQNVSKIAATGGAWSTANDMALWAQFLLANGNVDGEALISAEHFAQLFRPQVLVPEQEFYASMALTRPRWTSYGLGWFQQDYNGRYLAFHTGSLPGRTAMIGLVPDAQMAVVVLGNFPDAGLRKALMLRAIDIFAGTNGAPVRDWSAELMELYDGLQQQADSRQKENDELRVLGTRPTLPLAAYVGEYLHPAWGSFIIEELDGRLYGTHGAGEQNTGPLEHWHYDTFRITFGDGRGRPTTLQFIIGADGTVTQVLGGGSEKYRYDRPR
jgi:CubicO group peptidase (beta-lactamase class C family)